MSEIPESMASRVKLLRTGRDLSLQGLADLCGLTKSYLWDIEKGKQTNLTINSAVALARALGVSLDRLLGINTSMPDLRPEALRIAIEIDKLLRAAIRQSPNVTPPSSVLAGKGAVDA